MEHQSYEDYYFTFGTRHKHPVLGIPMEHMWIRITAPDYGAARKCMVALFGPRWSFQYREKDFSKSYFTKGEYIHITCGDVTLSKDAVDAHWEAMDE